MLTNSDTIICLCVIQSGRAVMNVQEYVCANDQISDRYNDDVYGLVTQLSRHILHSYRSSHRNVQFTYDHDIKIIKHLRIKAFEILLKKSDRLIPSQGDVNT